VKLKEFNPNKTFIIAEIGNNHEGNYQLAKKMINLASKSGVDAVKFQTYKTSFFINKNDKKRFKKLKNFELSYAQFKNLKKIANKLGLLFISTPFDLESANFLSKNSDIIKIASSDNNFFKLIDVVLKSKKPVIVSTGLANISEIKRIVLLAKKILKSKFNKNFALLHCVSAYPVEPKYANLNSIKFLKEKFNCIIGYSDHTIGNEASLVAISLGAKIIEKHFTINKKYSSFRDHQLSADFIDLKNIVDSSRKIELMLGKKNKMLQKNEIKNIKEFRRSIVSSRDLKKGEKLTEKDVKYLRPGNGLNPNQIKKIINKVLKKNLQSDQVIKMSDIS
jgi:N,N'-diacetyllegionaminate synthase|tara:strand:+ start:3500 stop:4504 length:1005 start_codon:yes stop_codon:yes gene_type:complete